MILHGEVISDVPEEYDTKKGHQKVQRLSVIDRDVSGHRVAHTMQYTLSAAEKDQYAGKLVDRFVDFGVVLVEKTPMGVMAFRGSILKVEAGKPKV